MALNPPACLKGKVAPLLARATEADNGGTAQFAKLAFYCRFAAADVGIKSMAALSASDQAEAGNFLGTLIEQIERDRATYGILKEEESADLELVQKYALSLFSAADKSDRSGAASKDTIKAYQAAGVFLDVVRQLNEASPAKLTNIAVYAKKRAVSIFTDLKNGRQPTPPEGSGSEMDLDAELAALGVSDGFDSSPSAGGMMPFAAVPGGGAGAAPSASSLGEQLRPAPAGSAAGYGQQNDTNDSKMQEDSPSDGGGAGNYSGFGMQQQQGGYPVQIGQAAPGGFSSFGQQQQQQPPQGGFAGLPYPSQQQPMMMSMPGQGQYPGPGVAGNSADSGGSYGGMPQPMQPFGQQQQSTSNQSMSGPVFSPPSRSTSTGALNSASGGFGNSGPSPSSSAAATPIPGTTVPFKGSGHMGDSTIGDAMEYTKFALAALKERNPERAFAFLASAINTLQPGALRG